MSEISRIREESHTFSIREPINIVLQFNGYNISVSTFTRVCRHASEFIPLNSEAIVIGLTINK